MIHLSTVSRKSFGRDDTYPFSVAAIKSLNKLTFQHSVTFLVGENGSGKSTFLEAVAAGTEAIAVGGADVRYDDSLEPARQLAANLTFGWRKKTGRGFFLRAEDFFNYARRLSNTAGELETLIQGYEEELKERPRDPGLLSAIGHIRAQKQALIRRYGEDLNANSHGESFMKLFEERMVPGGLYLLDEPEAALSPIRQLGLLSMMKAMVAEDCQFIIATHSPILMAFPEASIYSFDAEPLAEVDYEELEHVKLTKAFLNDPGAFLRRL